MGTYGEGVYAEESYGESANVTVRLDLQAAIAVAAGFPVAASGDSYTAFLSLATATAVGLPPAASQEATVLTNLAIARAVGLTPRIGGGTLTSTFAAAVVAGLAPVVAQVIAGGTDTSNVMDGRSRSGTSTGTTTRPVAAVPPGITLGERVDKAIAYPNPVMVNGRPT